MIRKLLLALGAVALLGVVTFFAAGPRLAASLMNRVVGGPEDGRWPVSAPAAALHQSATIVDLHGDTLLWQRDLLAPADYGHIDLPRLEAGHVALQVFSSVTKTPRGQNYARNSSDTDNITLLAVGQLQPLRTWTSLVERSLWHAEKLARAEAGSGGRLRIIRTAADLDRLLADRAAGRAVTGRAVTGALLSTEGAHNLEGRIGNVDRLYDAGFRMFGLVHFFDNELGGSMHGEAQYRGAGGLTPFGRQVVQLMERKGIIVDVAHSSAATVADVLAMASRPVVVSHGGVKATCDTPRNLSDDQLRALARNGGMIGIGYWDAAVCEPTPQATARAILHAVKVAGVDHVGLGSDFDGSVTTGFDTAHIDAVTEALLKAGMAPGDVRKVLGGNAVRLLRAGLVPR